jgi:hypothetical protein
LGPVGFQLDFGILTKFVEVLAVVIGAWFAMKAQIMGLQRGQDQAKQNLEDFRAEIRTASTEQLRQLAALHKRLDYHAQQIQKLDKQNAVMWDRLNRSTQRIPASVVEDNPFQDNWTPEGGVPER